MNRLRVIFETDRPEPGATPPLAGPDVPWGLSPLIDLIKMVNIISEQQVTLFEINAALWRQLLWFGRWLVVLGAAWSVLALLWIIFFLAHWQR